MLKVLQGFYRACHLSKSEADFGHLAVKFYENYCKHHRHPKKSTNHKKYKIKPNKSHKNPHSNLP